MGDQEILGKVLSIHVYPIKGCRPVTLSTAVATPMGFPYDRHWVIVDDKTDKAITQRTVAKMAVVETELPPAVFLGGPPSPEAALTIKLPMSEGTESVRIPLEKSRRPIKEIQVRSWTGRAADEGDEAAEKLTKFFGEPMRLYRFLDDRPIPVDEVFVDGFQKAFSDGFPYLIVNTKSHRHLQDSIAEPIAMNRFRANIVVEAQNPWEEDEWRQVQISSPEEATDGVLFELVKPCKRCVVTTVDQSSGMVGLQPLQMLRELRNGINTGFAVYLPQTKSQGFFGWNAVSRGEKRITVNDHVRLMQQGKWILKRTWYQYAKEKLGWMWK